MSTTTGAQNIDVASIWAGVRRALPALVLCTIAAGGLTFGALALMAPRYQSETQLTITAKSNNPYRGGKNDAGAAASVTPRLDPAAINTHVRAIQAPDLLLQVGHALKLGQRPEFNSAIGPVDTWDRLGRLLGLGGPRAGETIESRVVSAMRSNLTVSAARESRFISIRFVSTDPTIAAKVANAIAAAYRDSLREIPVRETNEAVAALEPKIRQLSREVFEAEAIAKRFRAETDQLTGGSTSLTLQQQRLSALSADLVKAEAERSGSEARLAAARELATRGGADTLPEVQNSRIIQDLMAQKVRVERQVNEARAVLLPAHPRMRQLNADLSGLRRSLNTEIRTIVSSISKEVRLSQLRTEQLRGQIDALKQVAVSKSGDEAKLRALETTAQSKRNELERLQKQLEDNRTVVDTNRVPIEATIVSMARPSGSPVFPKKTSYALLAMAATFMLGLALNITRGLLLAGGPVAHNRRASDQGLAQALRNTGRAAAATIQATASSTQRAAKPSAQPATQSAGTGNALASKLAGLSAALGGLSRKDNLSSDAATPSRPAATPSSGADMSDYARRFMTSTPADGGFRLLVAGASNAINPSNEAIELVGELSEAGANVLLIDWTLTGDRLFTDIDIGGTASLADLIAGRAEFENILVALPDSNLQYVFATDQPDQRQLLDENALNLILDALDEAYDHVVIAARYTDACALFETIQGRFDAGLTISEISVGRNLPGPETFLGFSVTDIDIVHHIRPRNRPAAQPFDAVVDQETPTPDRRPVRQPEQSEV